MNWRMLTTASCAVLGFMLQGNPVKAVKSRSPEHSAQSAVAQHVAKKVLEKEMPVVAEALRTMEEQYAELKRDSPAEYEEQRRGYRERTGKELTIPGALNEILKGGGDPKLGNMLADLNLRALPGHAPGDDYDDDAFAALHRNNTSLMMRNATLGRERDAANAALALERQEVADAEMRALAAVARTSQAVNLLRNFQPQDDLQNGWISPQEIQTLTANMQALDTVDVTQAYQALRQERDDARADAVVAMNQLQQSNDELQHVQRDIRAIVDAVAGNPDLATRLNVDATADLTDSAVFARVVNDIQTLQLIDPGDHARLNDINQQLRIDLAAEQNAHQQMQQERDFFQNTLESIADRLQLLGGQRNAGGIQDEIIRLQAGAQTPPAAQPDLSQFAGVVGLGNNPTVEDILAKLNDQEGRIEALGRVKDQLFRQLQNGGRRGKGGK